MRQHRPALNPSTMGHRERSPESDAVAADRNATYTIQQLRREFGCTSRALRHYEELELLSPARDGLVRIYTYQDRARIKIILRGKRLRIPLEDIRRILCLYNSREDTKKQDELALETYRSRLANLRRERDQIDEIIAELTDHCRFMEGRLGEVFGACTHPITDAAEATRIR